MNVQQCLSTNLRRNQLDGRKPGRLRCWQSSCASIAQTTGHTSYVLTKEHLIHIMGFKGDSLSCLVTVHKQRCMWEKGTETCTGMHRLQRHAQAYTKSQTKSLTVLGHNRVAEMSSCNLLLRAWRQQCPGSGHIPYSLVTYVPEHRAHASLVQRTTSTATLHLLQHKSFKGRTGFRAISYACKTLCMCIKQTSRACTCSKE